MIPENETDEEYVTRVRLRPIHGRLALCRNEPSLMPYEHLLYGRYQRFEGRLEEIEKNHGTLQAFSAESYKLSMARILGRPTARRGMCDTWNTRRAPSDCPSWATSTVESVEFEGERDEFGKWTLDIPAAAGLEHGSQVRVVMESHDGRQFDRVPAWIQRIVQCCDEESGETRCYHNGVYHATRPRGSGTSGSTRSPSPARVASHLRGARRDVVRGDAVRHVPRVRRRGPAAGQGARV